MLLSGLTVTGLEAAAWVLAVVAGVALLLSPRWFVSAFTARGMAVDQPARGRAGGQSSQQRQQPRPPTGPSGFRQRLRHASANQQCILTVANTIFRHP